MHVAWWQWFYMVPILLLTALGPMLASKDKRPKSCPKCGGKSVRFIYARRRTVYGWALVIVGGFMHGWWQLLMVLGMMIAVSAPTTDPRGFCVACRHGWPLDATPGGAAN